jgi:hypothetical protein
VASEGNRARFTVPKFLVYGVARVHLEEGDTRQQSGRATPPVRHRRHDPAMARNVIHEQYATERAVSAPFEPFDHAECSHSF